MLNTIIVTSASINEPFLVFTVILFVILLVPIFLHNSKIPGVVGLILSGFLLGPHSFNIIAHSEIIELFSKVGLLYLMFLTGMEIDLSQFKKSSTQNILFGIFTFFIPFFMAYGTSDYLLGLSFNSSVFVGIMIASNTLIAFPLAEKYGITKSIPVNIAISGTIIADTLVLIILAVISSDISSKPDGNFLLSFVLPFFVFIALLVFGLPVLSRWFFRTVPADSKTHYLFVLAVMFASAFVADVIGAEPIIGAFFAGLGLNRSIPHISPLMNRINFIGQTLFIPVFLISVGMLINLSEIISSIPVFFYSILLVVIAITGKWLAAWLIKIFFLLTKAEMYTIFGLTTARAAATLAIAFVGKEFGLLSDDIFNAAMALIIVSSLYSSFITDKYGKKFAREENKRPHGLSEKRSCRILVPISNPDTAGKLMEIALFIKSKKSIEPIFPIAVVKDDRESQHHILLNKTLLDQIRKNTSESGIAAEGLVRLDVNVPVAIVKASKELMISKIVMGWSGQSSEIKKVFGNMLEYIVLESSSEIVVCNLPIPVNTMNRIAVMVPPNSELEIGFEAWIDTITNLGSQLSSSYTFYASPATFTEIQKILRIKGLVKNASWENKSDISFEKFGRLNGKDTLSVIINSRPHSVSFDPYFWKLTFRLPKPLSTQNVLNIYPVIEQYHSI